jgi:hypothetical protein
MPDTLSYLEAVKICFDCLWARGKITTTTEFNTKWLRSSSASYYQTRKSRQRISLEALHKLSQALERAGETDLSKLIMAVMNFG